MFHLYLRNYCTIMLCMPTLIRLPHCSIHMYAGDHLPPHFHIRMRDGREALIEIARLIVLRGTIPARELKPALDWAMAHQAMIEAKWLALNP